MYIEPIKDRFLKCEAITLNKLSINSARNSYELTYNVSVNSSRLIAIPSLRQ